MFGRHYSLTTGEDIYITLVIEVKNGEELKDKVMGQELQCCFIKPSLIIDPFQIALAADKAALARSRGKLVTKSVYTEILFNLSPSKQISKSLGKFGSQGRDQSLILCTIGSEEEFKSVLSQVQGKEVDFSQLSELTHLDSIMKEYNIKAPETVVSSTLDSVITRIAAKKFLQ